MKKITLLLVLTTLISASVMAQSNMITGRVAYRFSAAGESLSAQYGGGFGFEKGLTDKIAFGGGIDYLTGATAGANTSGSGSSTLPSGTASWISIEPKITLYGEEEYTGFFFGSNFAFNLGLSEYAPSQIDLGIKLGRSWEVADVVRVIPSFNIGYSKAFDKSVTTTSGGTSVTTTIVGGGGLFFGGALTFGYVLGGN